VRFALRIGGWVAVAVALPFGAGSAAGALGVVIGLAVTAIGLLAAWFWLPRSAHAAFEVGRFARAARRYALLQHVAVSAARERSALLSRAGCHVAADQVARAEEFLAALDGDALDPSERAVWLNNRACAALSAGREAARALALADEAGALRPDVPALQHTRALALLAVGRTEDAIAVLDGMRAGGELSPRLEAERCRDLARAWRSKGELAYAEDYQRRADGYARGR
jgi:predicted Zn-dependent protease